MIVHPARSRAAALVVLAVCVTAACAPPPEPSPPPGWDQYYLTRDGADVTTWTPTGPDSAEVVGAATNGGENSRMLMVRTDSVPEADGETCATFRDDHALAQEGVALRVRKGARGVRALTVTKNIWFGGHWHFNVHSWRVGDAPLLAQHGSVDMSHVVGRRPQRDETWSLCAQATGSNVAVKVWRPADGPEPSWEHPSVRHVTVPASEVAVGRSGWNVGHVPAGFHAWFSGLRIGERPTGET